MTLTIAQIMSRLPEALVPKAMPGVDAVVHFKFTGEQAGEWNATIEAGKCEVAQGIPRRRPTITLTADSSDFCRVAAGDVEPAQAFMEGRIRLAGDVELARQLLAAMRAA